MTTVSAGPVTLTVPDTSPAALAALTAEIAATAAAYDRSGEIPAAGLAAAHRGGYLTATVAARYGGPELDPLEVVRILVALGEGDPSVALIAANNLAAHRIQTVAGGWPEDVYAELLRRSAEGPALVNAIRAEPELGAPARGGLPATVAGRTESGWILNGHKTFATGGRALAYHLVWAVTDETPLRVGHFIVPADADGIAWRDSWDHLGLRASNTHDVSYTDVAVPRGNFLEIPQQDGVYRDPAATAGPSSFGHAALYVGVARAARTAFVEYARTRVPTALGHPIADTERIQAVAGEIETQIIQAETLLYGTLLRLAADEPDVANRLSPVKVLIARSVIAAVETAVAALGNAALTRRNPLERHLRDVLCVRVHPPQEDAAVLAAGRAVLRPGE
ncbi:acyl-CoA/acyl-ACP dehydrogenase [Nocardia sp. NBC_00565]|uniref:acyl-CoA dehydrogenase family protein n=1 Tax=Nocardia sp. NBC_00565 TaxID=2975993 RepID=UPI002E80307A|nr:acyl-CoA dehydrogenase family protein [Nocardia sp. NBC_00565]WUC06715.1 acyl-CoA/acyl-ACP dehydrogenase [Nocardia sp. NBC_00565]